MINAIIIDDEKIARDVVKTYLQKHQQEIHVVAECTNGFEGVKAITELKPDLIFLDIQMPKLTGFEMLELLDEQPCIIFSTAYDEFAIRAFEMSAADYLLKPYDQERFDKAIQQAMDKIGNTKKTEVDEVLKNVNQTIEKLERVVIKQGTKIIILSIDEINYFEAQDDYVAVHTEDGKKYLKQWTMKFLEEALPVDRFVRVHRSYIVKLDSIDKLEAYSKDSYLAKLKSGETTLVSRSGYQKLKEALNL